MQLNYLKTLFESTYIKGKKQFKTPFMLGAFLVLFNCLAITALSQPKIAILTPEKNEQVIETREKLAQFLSNKASVFDFSLSEAVLKSKAFENPFNLSLEESRNLGTAIGCDFFVLLKSDSLRRFSLDRDSYNESYAAFYLVSSKTGRLVHWKLLSLEGKNLNESKTKLFNSVNKFSVELIKKIKTIQKKELSEDESKIEELPNEDSPEAKGFRPPLPFKRIRPKYTQTAYLYNIAATVDINVDISEEGKILNTEVSRWAGFGLDESAVETIKKMNWRPAERNGKFLPMRILLRYNFKKIETDE